MENVDDGTGEWSCKMIDENVYAARFSFSFCVRSLLDPHFLKFQHSWQQRSFKKCTIITHTGTLTIQSLA